LPAKAEDALGSDKDKDEKPQVERPKKRPSRDRDRDKDSRPDRVEKAEKPEPKAESKAEGKEPEAKAESKDADAKDAKDDGGSKKATKRVALAEGKQTPAQLSDAAKKAEAVGDWETVLAAYQRLEKAKGYKYPGYAVYKQAWAYFQLNDVANAQALAQRASSMPGKQRGEAKLLFADALFKQGDFKRAKDFYIGLRKQAPKAERAQLAKKIASCNQKLKLPDRDGITD
jgi:hypothetical protein